MSPLAASTVSIRKQLAQFRRNRSGVTAVEFALVAPVFFALLFAIIETALIFFAGQVLETTTQDSARQIFTGQAQGAAMTQAQFATFVCGQMSVLFNCTDVKIDVQNYNSSFSAVAINSQIDPGGNFVDNMHYNPGGPCDVVVVRLFYQWPLFVTGLGYNISNLAGNKRLLSATAAFRNEPYNGSCS